MPPLMTKVPVDIPSAWALLMLSVPAVRVTPPVNVLTPPRAKPPLPALVIRGVALPAESEMMPPIARVPALAVMVRDVLDAPSE